MAEEILHLITQTIFCSFFSSPQLPSKQDSELGNIISSRELKSETFAEHVRPVLGLGRGVRRGDVI